MKCIVNKLFIGALFLLGALVCSCQNTTENTVESSVDSPGEMNFEFDLTYREGKQSVEQLTDMADSYYIPMSIVNTPEALEDPVVHKYLNTPQRLTSGY
jgi:hypothetical protein